jgi:hypothetical protein
MHLPLFILLLTCLPALTAERSCRILFLNGPEDAPQKLHLFDGTNSQEVELPRMNFSPVYQIHPDSLALALLPSPPPPPTASSPPTIPPGAPTATLSKSITDFYLIISSDPSNTIAPVRMQVINANTANFKRGQMLWYNLTENTVGGLVGSRRLLVKPNSRLILDAPANSLEDYPVNIHFQPPGKTRTEPLCETRWTHDPRSRSVFFILKPTGSLIPRILGFPDFRSEVESKSEGT